MREERGEETEEQEGGDGVRRIHGRRWEGALSGEREGCGGAWGHTSLPGRRPRVRCAISTTAAEL